MRSIQFREAICEAMSEEMRRDESIYLMGEEVAEYNGAYKASKGMLDEFGDKRVIDTPISELGFAGVAIGSTMTGNRPIVEYMTFNFSLVGIDQIINNAAKIRQMSGGQLNCPIVFRGPTASAGQLGATHSQAFESWYANTPGLKVIVPSNPYDAKGLLKSAIRDDDPVIFMESEQMYGDKGEVPEGEYTLPIGVADIKREGKDVTIVSFGKIIKEAYKAADELEIVKIGRLFSIALAIAAMLIAPQFEKLQSIFTYLQKVNGLYSVPIIGIFMLGIGTKHVPALAAKVGMIVGISFYAFYKCKHLIQEEDKYIH